MEKKGIISISYWIEYQREYPSPVRMNILRIDSAGESRMYIYRSLGRRPLRGENLSLIKMNISRIDSLENKSRDCNYLFTG